MDVPEREREPKEGIQRFLREPMGIMVKRDLKDFMQMIIKIIQTRKTAKCHLHEDCHLLSFRSLYAE